MKKAPPVPPSTPSALALALEAHKKPILIAAAVLVGLIVAGVVVYKMNMGGAPNANAVAGTPAAAGADGSSAAVTPGATYYAPPVVPYRAPGTSGAPLNSQFLKYK